MAESAPSSGNCNPEREGEIALNLTMELKQTAGNGEEGRETGAAKMVFVVFAMHVLSAAWGTSPAGAYAVCKKAGVQIWECRNCGHLVIGTDAPDLCPVCKHPQSYFEITAENY